MDIKDIERVKVTRLRRDTAYLLASVRFGGERFVVTSSGKERAALVSIGDLERLVRLPQEEGNARALDFEDHVAMESGDFSRCVPDDVGK